jgi:hypothetical protein
MVDVDWDLVRVDYEARLLTLAEMEVKHGVSKTAIILHARAGKWIPRRKTIAKRADILSRVYRILEELTQRMEESLAKGESRYGTRDLAAVTRTLEKLISLNKAETVRKNDPPESAAIKRLRDKLADRIEQLNQG